MKTHEHNMVFWESMSSQGLFTRLAPLQVQHENGYMARWHDEATSNAARTTIAKKSKKPTLAGMKRWFSENREEIANRASINTMKLTGRPTL